MKRLASSFAILAAGTLVLGSGCAPKSVSSQSDSVPAVGRDSVIVPDVGYVPTDLIRNGDITVAGAATFETLSVADLSLLRATSHPQLESAERAINSGAYLGDPVRVVHVQGTGDPGVIGYQVGEVLTSGFETEFVGRFQQGGGTLVLELVAETTQPGRRMPSLMRVTLALDGGEGNRMMVHIGQEGGSPSELVSAQLGSFSPDEYAHRVRVRYEPGTISVELNGAVVLEAATRLGGGEASAAILAQPASSAYALSWTLEALPE